jgi:DNA ligase-1
LIAQTLKKAGITALDEMQIQIGIPIRPAAAERMPSPQAVFEKLGACVAQPKLDGFRLQIHIDKSKGKPRIDFFSRNLIDMSAMFPDLVNILLQLDIEMIICEGEAISYDPHTGTFLPFQETVKRKRKHGIEQAVAEFPLQCFLFDLLYLNGKSYLDMTHEERRKALILLIDPLPDDNIVKVVPEAAIHSAQELEQYFLQIIGEGLEGLVVKKPTAIYQPGKRNFNWIKLKRHEEGELEDTIDAVVLGYYAGTGKRTQFGIGAFLVGIFNPALDQFQTIAKIGTGLKDEEWKELRAKCDKLRVTGQPHNVECAKELFPDVWVAPEIMVTILADEITLSPLHSACKTPTSLGYALRFPRFISYRTDKNPTQATSATEIKRLYENQFKS